MTCFVNIYFLLKSQFLFQFILVNLFYNANSEEDECLINLLSEFSYPNAEEIANGNKIIITKDGIYTFNPSFSKVLFSYNFTEEQKFTNSIDTEIYQSKISQFSNEIPEEVRSSAACCLRTTLSARGLSFMIYPSKKCFYKIQHR